MPRYAQLLGLTLIPLTVGLGCSDDCTSPFDCKSTEICYKGTCESGQNSALDCESDDECGMDPGGGRMRPFVCIAKRCRLNEGAMMVGPMTPDSGLGPVDTGPGPGDAGPVEAGGFMDAASVPDSGITPSTCTPPTLPANAMGTAADTTSPSVFNPVITPPAPNAGDMLSVTVQVGEGGCGVESANLTIESDPAGTDPVQRITASSGAGLLTITGMGTPYTLTMNATVLNCLQPVPHRVTQLFIRDYAGNSSTYRYDANDTACMPQLPGNPNAECYKLTTNGNLTPASTSVQVMQMTPNTTGSLPPTLNAATLTGSGATLSGNIGVNPDATCPVMTMGLTLTNGIRTKVETVPFNGGAYSIDVDACAANGNWEISGIVLTDMQLRQSNYLKIPNMPTYQLYGTAGSGVNVPAAVPLTGGADMASPVWTKIVTVVSNNAASGTSVMTDFHATDPDCGLGSGVATFTNGTGNAFTGVLAAGGPGVFGCVFIPQCAPRGSYTLTGTVIDRYSATSTLYDNTMGGYGLFQSDGTMTSSVPAALIQITHN